MKKRDLLKQINNLKKTIKPDSAWQKANREILLSQIKSQTSAEFSYSHKIMLQNLFLAVYKPVGSMILICSVLFGAWIASVGATKNSQPGDLLYGLKLTAERMQVNLTMNDEKRTNLEIAFAERRLDEIKQTTAKDGSNKNKKNLEVTLKNFQESINNVKSNLAKLEATDKQAALKVADLIDEKTKSYVGILKDQQDQNPQFVASENAEQAISDSKATGNKALSVILEEFEAGNSGLKVDDLRQKINTRIDDLDKNIESAKSDIPLIIENKKIADEAAAAKALADKEAAKKAEEEAAAKVLADKEALAKTELSSDASELSSVQEVANTNTNTSPEPVKEAQPELQNTNSSAEIKQDEQIVSQPEEVLPTIDEIKNKPAEAAALLVRARDYVKSGSVSQAFDLVKQADDIMTLVNKVIKANSVYLEAPEEVKVGEPVDVMTNLRLQ
ncbi:MAG: DUF5667 domain-containing protein [Patescibacteria group bacterium]